MNRTTRMTVRALGGVPPGLLWFLASRLAGVFPVQPVIGESLPVPADALNERRSQYHAVTVLNALQRSRPAGGARTAAGAARGRGIVLGVTAVDLFVPRLNFVFGVAGGGAALVSLHRLRPELQGRPPDQELLQHRALIEAVHELGHLYGLGHCTDPGCVMFFSNTLEDTDHKGPSFCRVCAGRLPTDRH